MLEAIYHPHRDGVGWAQQALDVLETTFETSLSIGLQVIEHNADFSHVQPVLSHGSRGEDRDSVDGGSPDSASAPAGSALHGIELPS